MKIYQCEDSIEGIFTAIYNVYEDKCSHTDTRISLTDELFLFAEYITVQTDVHKARKVINTLCRRFGQEDYWKVCMALASFEQEKAQAVYQTIVNGLTENSRVGHLLDNLANESVHRTFTLFRATNNEYLHLRGFIRFSELENGVLYAKINPKNNVLTFLMPHFADRFPLENFMLYDGGRQLFGIHPAGSDWYLVQEREENFNEELFQMSKGELRYQELFQYFCHKIAIKERKNLTLQRNMLPLRFRENMIEFDVKEK